MSIYVMSRVWEESPHSGGKLLLLLALADYANRQGVAWPKLSDLAEKARMSERHVRRSLRELEESGDLETRVGGYIHGVAKASTYRLKFKGDILSKGDIEDMEGDAQDPDPGTPTSPQPSVEPSVEEEPSETTGADQSALFDAGTPEPSSSKPIDPDDAKLDEVWANHVKLFGDRMRVKELTPPRRRTLVKALKAVGGDHTMLMRASDGLKSYRERNPDGSQNVGIDVIFETGPHSSKNLTEQIEWWSFQAQGSSAERHDIPSVLRDRVRRRRVMIVEALSNPHLSGAKERAEEARAWLREHAHEEPVIENGKVIEWRRI